MATRKTPAPPPTPPPVEQALVPEPETTAKDEHEAILKRGDRGPAVRELQLGLKALGLYALALDGQFGPGTEKAVQLFEQEHGLPPDGIADAYMLGRLDQELLVVPDERPDASTEHGNVFCSQDTLRAWEDRVVPLLTSTPVMYAPGRGLGASGALLVSHKDGMGGDLARGARAGKKTYGFVCSTFVNWALSFLTGRSDEFTPKGGMPPLMELCERQGVVRWRDIPFKAYGENCTRLFPGRMDVLPTELQNLDRSGPRFLAVAQSTCNAQGKVTKWLHHVAIWWVSSDGIWRRMAADGSKGSFTPMNVERMDFAALKVHAQNTRLLVYALHSLPTVHPEVKLAD